ncbi:MAG: protein kinase [Candidatus Eisenbacteria bacterium]|nr:protein kinase [Candidatus Eisenbacteria bacterium]
MEDITGKTISHYRVSERIGMGGMGVIYAAEDTRLRRSVALKFLSPELTRDPEAKQRFVQEAQTASSLDHPSICTIHEIDETPDGRMFIVMPLYRGETLSMRISRGRLELMDALDITEQIARGLMRAHGQRIVHRDIKPANILVTQDGQVKILDFGLAKLTGQTQITRAGSAVGTVSYMSPEQLRGEEADGRADIWALGVLIYEMISGRHPFRDEYPEAIMYSILNQEPEPLGLTARDVSRKLDDLVGKALAKNRESRYQNIADLLASLASIQKGLEAGLTGTEERAHPSVAVLPFTDLSPAKDQEYFCDGMAEEIINALTHVEGLRVVARSSAFAFKGKNEDVRDIGRKLNVRTVLEGSVRKAGDTLRITAQVVNVRDGYHVWSERFDRKMQDVFAIQDEISLAIAEKLRGELLDPEIAALMKRSTTDIDAYQLYLKGRYHWNKRTPASLKKSIELFEEAINMDPAYALAYAGLADAYGILTGFGEYPDMELYEKAERAASKALELAPELAEAHTSLAYLKQLRHWDWDGAGREFRRAIELKPGYATAHQWYAGYLCATGRSDDAVREARMALELDPLSLVINVSTAGVFFRTGWLEEAATQCRKVIEMEPNFPNAHFALSMICIQQGKLDEAVLEHETGLKLLSETPPAVLCQMGYIYGMARRTAEAGVILKRVETIAKKAYVPGTAVAMLYIGLGRFNEALDALERAYRERDNSIMLLGVEPAYKPLRADPRFKALLRNVGLERHA